MPAHDDLIRFGAIVMGATVLAGSATLGSKPVYAASSSPNHVTQGATNCVGGEEIIYTCPFGKKVASVCATKNRVTYRYGPRGAPEIAVTSTGSDGIAHSGAARGGGGGGEDNLRFSRAGYEYIVYSATAGNLTDVPGKVWSGVVVMKDGKEISRLKCPVSSPRQEFGMIPFAVDEETDDRYEGWQF